jgi:hypothetical protein
MIGKAPALVLGGDPRVQLLPPAVIQREKAQRGKRLIAMSVVLALAIVAAGYSLAFVRLATAQSDLLAAQNRTQELLLEQQSYAEAAAAASDVATVEGARSLVTSTEIAWDQVMAEVAATLPGGSTIETATMTGQTPWGTQPLTAGPLRAQYVATIDLTVSLPSIPDVAALQRSLSAVTGYADSAISTVTSAEGSYSAQINLTLTSEAYTARFAEEPVTEDADDETATDSEVATTEGAETMEGQQ